jgi:LacI family transcriptional regulator
MVGLVVGSMIDPYYGAIAEAVTMRCETVGSMAAIVTNMQRDPLLEIQRCRQLRQHRVAGLVLAGGGFDQVTHYSEFASEIGAMSRAGITVVSLSPRGISIPTFCVDNERVSELMATRLVERGHQTLGVLMGPQQSETTQQRTAGVLRVLRAAGVEWELLNSGYSRESGHEAILSLLRRSPDITGVIVGADSLAIGVIEQLREGGYRVPTDVSVISIGNTIFGQLIEPNLSTVDVSLAACAKTAVDYIAERVEGRIPVGWADFPIKMIDGGTIGPPRSDHIDSRGKKK